MKTSNSKAGGFSYNHSYFNFRTFLSPNSRADTESFVVLYTRWGKRSSNMNRSYANRSTYSEAYPFTCITHAIAHTDQSRLVGRSLFSITSTIAYRRKKVGFTPVIGNFDFFNLKGQDRYRNTFIFLR